MHVGNDEILRGRQPDVAGAVALGEAGDVEELLGADPADRNGQADIVVAGLPLRHDAEVIGGLRAPFVAAGHEQRPAHATLQFRPESRDAPCVYQERQARFVA